MGIKNMKRKKSPSVQHQFSLFGYMKPKTKIQLKSALIRAKELYATGDTEALVKVLRYVRERLEEYEDKISIALPDGQRKPGTVR
jgi:hypothetical protein